MAENSSISWTHHTFNPWMGCAKVSDGCKNCYAETLTTNRMGKALWGVNAPRQVTSKAYWRNPIKWEAKAAAATVGGRARVFCGSLCDVFDDHWQAAETRPRLWKLIQDTPGLDWLLLTKRPENIGPNLPDGWGAGWPNVWLGTSVEDMRVAHRANTLRRIPARVRFISYESALGPLDGMDLDGIHWLIYGGESGPGYRPDNIDWARRMRLQCKRSGTSFFYKQSSGSRAGTSPLLDGDLVQEYPVAAGGAEREAIAGVSTGA